MQQDDVEIDLIKLAKYLLFKWKSIVVCGMIFTVLGLGYLFYKHGFSLQNLSADAIYKVDMEEVQPNGTKKIVSKEVNRETYQKIVETRTKQQEQVLDKKKLAEDVTNLQIAKLEKEFSMQQQYLFDSVLLNMEPDKYNDAVFYYCVDDGNKEVIIYNPNINSQAVANTPNVANNDATKNVKTIRSSVYTCAKTLLNSSKYIALVAKALGIDEKSVKLVREFIALHNLDEKSFTITARADSADKVERLKEIIGILNDDLNAIFSNNGKSISIRLISESNMDSANALDLLKITENLALKTLQQQLENAKSALLNADNALPSVAIPAPLNPNKHIVTKCAKYGAVGLFVGIFVYTAFLTLLYLLQGKIRDAEVISRILGIRSIACIRDSAFSEVDTEEELKLKNSLELLCKDKNKICIVSTLDYKKHLGEVMENIKVALQGKELVVAHPYEVHQISECDGIVFVERIDISNLQKLMTSIKDIQVLKKEVLGIVYA